MTEQANRVMPILRWSKQISFKGTIGTNLNVTPASSHNILIEMMISAPFFDDDTTIKIYNDSVASGNLIFDGYMANRDSDGIIKLQEDRECTTKWIVVTTGTAGDLYVMARYD